ncbi:hypothetical protein PSH76_08380 [Pseudomonas sp. FP215]|uniref:hypothetical protein n=1 Tax=Pseudomonas sp. FP215 TaxID=2738126 RepID=UPI0027347968|nr:hypothetical protein [Pseudomonas sp. FP215]WLH25834.1 hypothetical protein PSH76_08380 [Pseudomonas sp. FP215]
MNEVDRFTRQGVGASDRAGFWVHAGDFNQKMSQAQDREDYLKDQIEKWTALHGEHFKRAEILKLERDALQQRLTVSDERADVLGGLLLQTNELLYAIQGDPGAVPSSSIDAMRGRVFEALKRTKPPTCTWTEGGFSWHTGCGKEWQFTDGGLPAENGMHFCHSCGMALVVDEDQPESERES